MAAITILLQTRNEDGEELKVSVHAAVANNSMHTVISDRLARQLCIEDGEAVEARCPFSGHIYCVHMPSKAVSLVAPAFIRQGDSIFVSFLINKNKAFYDCILGKDFLRNPLVDANRVFGHDEDITASPGPGFEDNTMCMGHNAHFSADVMNRLVVMSRSLAAAAKHTGVGPDPNPSIRCSSLPPSLPPYA